MYRRVAGTAIAGNYACFGTGCSLYSERGGWCSVYCGAPLLPGWLLRRIAASAGVHFYTPLGAQVHHRGPLLSVYFPGGGDLTISARPGQNLTPIVPKGSERHWRPDTAIQPGPDLTLRFDPGETKFFRTGV